MRLTHLLWSLTASILPCHPHAANCYAETCSLQTAPSEPLMPEPKCELPKSATWTMVQIPQVKPYWLAVYAAHDYLSNEVLARHTWEGFHPEDFGIPGHAVDIGANLGFFSFALAKSGWNVTSFEPMRENQALFKANLCANPDVVEQIDLHEVGLGDANKHCYLVAPTWNMGDGYVSCGNDTNPVIRPYGSLISRCSTRRCISSNLSSTRWTLLRLMWRAMNATFSRAPKSSWRRSHVSSELK